MRLNTVPTPQPSFAVPGAPSALLPVAVPAASSAARRARVSQPHQAWISLIPVGGYGSGGFQGVERVKGGIGVAVRPMTDDASGVPPRGRPV